MNRTEHLLTCPMCGRTYNPQANPACPSCPINKSCSLACCPHCGYETVDPQHSSMVYLLRKITTLIRPGTTAGGTTSREG
jgi:hypothetical protein